MFAFSAIAGMSSDEGGVLSKRPLLRRALLPMVVFFGVVAVTIVGFVALAGIDVVEAAYWLITPENIGIYFRDTEGPETATKGFAVVSRLAQIVTGLWIGQTVASALFGGQLTEELKRVTQEKKIATFSDHVVICGYGMFGETVAYQLNEAGTDVVVIEQDDDKVSQVERDGHLVVDGDARQETTLERAGIEDAATVVAAIDDSNVNLQISVLASQLAPDATLIVRVGEQTYASTARRAGADTVVIPEIMSGSDIAGELTD